ncbi:MAG: choice-of-anchor V domain-containing protein [Bacteroidota bacterium]
MKLKLNSVYSLFLIILVSYLSLEFSGGIGGEYAGAPGDGGVGMNATCASNNGGCHSAGAGTFSGGVELLDLPATYVPGQTYSLRLRLTDSNATFSRGGFQLLATEDGTSNTQYGTFIPSDTETRVSSGRLTHRGAKSQSNDEIIWSFDYQVPASRNANAPANIVFFYTGNAANGGGVGTDYIYDNISDVALPVELLGFYANLNEKGQIELNWATAIEVNSDYFVIEKSENGIDFDEIGQVNAAGSSFNNFDYQFTDIQSRNGLYYYRLKLVDKDASFEYSKSISIEVENEISKLRIFPNPVLDVTTFNLSDLEETHVNIFDAAGKSILSRVIFNGDNSMDLSHLAKGNYFVRYQTNKGVKTEQLLKL